MQPRTVSLRTFLVVVGILAIAFVIGLAGIGKIEITPATVEATTDQSPPQEITYITQEGSPDHPDQELLSRIYEGATQSVVSILVRLPESRLEDPSQPQGGQGSGWVWDEDGHIVTNNHVVENATEIIVNFANGMWAEAELVARDPQSDLAVLRVEAPDGMSLRPLTRAEIRCPRSATIRSHWAALSALKTQCLWASSAHWAAASPWGILGVSAAIRCPT